MVHLRAARGAKVEGAGTGRESATIHHGTFAWAFGKPGLGIFCVVQTVSLRLGAQQRCLFCHSGGWKGWTEGPVSLGSFLVSPHSERQKSQSAHSQERNVLQGPFSLGSYRRQGTHPSTMASTCSGEQRPGPDPPLQVQLPGCPGSTAIIPDLCRNAFIPCTTQRALRRTLGLRNWRENTVEKVLPG